MKKITNAEFSQTWSDAMKFVKFYSLTNDVQNALFQKVYQENLKVEDVAGEWIAANEAIWGSWIK